MLQNAPLGAFCNTFDLHSAIIVRENHFWSFLRVAVFYTGFNCNHNMKKNWNGRGIGKTISVAAFSLLYLGKKYVQKNCVKRPLKNRQNKDLNDKW